MTSFYNKDSSITIPANILDSVKKSLIHSYLNKAWNNLQKIITVNEKTMNEICPPEKRLNLECTREIIRISEEEHYSTDVFYEKLSTCKQTYYPLGCYDSKNKIIYICPERIWKYQYPEIVFVFTLFHEVTHAYLDSGYNTLAKGISYDVIEESLCNATAYYHMKNKTKILDLLEDQPAEYRCYTYWLKFSQEDVAEFLYLWKEIKSRLSHKYFERFIYLITKQQIPMILSDEEEIQNISIRKIALEILKRTI